MSVLGWSAAEIGSFASVVRAFKNGRYGGRGEEDPFYLDWLWPAMRKIFDAAAEGRFVAQIADFHCCGRYSEKYKESGKSNTYRYCECQRLERVLSVFGFSISRDDSQFGELIDEHSDERLVSDEAGERWDRLVAEWPETNIPGPQRTPVI